jgi:leucyl-tRNA synthetase
MTKDLTNELAVQINGKMRGTIPVPEGTTEQGVLEMIREHEQFSAHISGEISKIIYIPGKIINIVVSS